MSSAGRSLTKLLIGLVVLAIVLQFVDVSRAIAALKSMRIEWVLASVGCFLGTRLIMAMKWWVLLGGRDASVSLPTVQRAICLSDFYSLLFPNTLANDATRVVLLRHSKEGIKHVTSGIMADRVLNVSMTAIVSLVALLLIYSLQGAIPFSTTVFRTILGLSFLVLLISATVSSRAGLHASVTLLRAAIRPYPRLKGLKKIADAAEDVHRGMVMMLTTGRSFWPAAILAVLLVVVRVGSVHTLFLAVDVQLPFLLSLAIVPPITLVALLPVSLFGLGLKDGAFVLLFGGANVSTSLALAVSLSEYGVIIGSTIIIGLVASVVGPSLPKAQTRNHLGGSQDP